MTRLTNQVPIMARAMQGDEDFWLVRALLVESYTITPLGFNWDVRRWDGRRFYNADPAWNPAWEALTRLWVTHEGRVIGAAHSDREGEVHLQVHPEFRHLEPEMLAWAEENLALPDTDERGRILDTFVYDYDGPRQQLLSERGYQRLPTWGVARRMLLDDDLIPAPQTARGYAIRTTSPDESETGQRIAELLNAAFRRDWHSAAEYHTFARLAPSFRRELDLVAVAQDGTFAAYVGVPYDTDNRRGIFEPVCTHPDHRRRGLAIALMREGLQRLRRLGAREVTVDTGSMEAANRLYDSLGFNEVHRGHDWRKRLT